jgi:hypothetical protein
MPIHRKKDTYKKRHCHEKKYLIKLTLSSVFGGCSKNLQVLLA